MAAPARLVVVGEVDVATAPQLVEALADVAIVELDLTDVTFIDGAGLTALVTAREHGDRARLVLLTPSTAVTRILDLCGESDAFSVWP